MQKREARVAISENASLKSGYNWVPCALVNMSDHGFLIKCSEAFPMGQVLEFSCELYPSKTLNCKIEIRHISAAGMGTKIVEINEYGVRLRTLYLEEQYSNNLSGRH
jgi:hypothetical protein